MINMEIEYEDCALVLKPSGGIEVYCPPDAAAQDNVKMLRSILIALVHSVSDSADVPKLIEEIDQNLSAGVDTTQSRVLH
jgi:hypothetical protein